MRTWECFGGPPRRQKTSGSMVSTALFAGPHASLNCRLNASTRRLTSAASSVSATYDRRSTAGALRSSSTSKLMRGFHSAAISVVPGSNAASNRSMETTRWIEAPKLNCRALPLVARWTCTWSVVIRKPLGSVLSSSFNTKLLPRLSFGTIAQVMW